MSADNWTTCPNCLNEYEKKLKLINESYGKVSAEEYIKMLSTLKDPVYNKSTLREDYEMGIKDGVFEINYQSYCEICDWGFKYNFVKDVLK